MERNQAGAVLSYKGIRCVDSLTSSQLLEWIGKEVDQLERLLAERISRYRAMKNSATHLYEQFCLYHEILLAVEKENVCEQGER